MQIDHRRFAVGTTRKILDPPLIYIANFDYRLIQINSIQSKTYIVMNQI